MTTKALIFFLEWISVPFFFCKQPSRYFRPSLLGNNILDSSLTLLTKRILSLDNKDKQQKQVKTIFHGKLQTTTKETGRSFPYLIEGTTKGASMTVIILFPFAFSMRVSSHCMFYYWQIQRYRNHNHHHHRHHHHNGP